MSKKLCGLLGVFAMSLSVPACSASDDAEDGLDDGIGAECTTDSDFGCAGTTQDEVREAIVGPAVRATSAEAWAVTRKWADVDAAAGLAWPANSGLSWEEKFHQWVLQVEKVRGDSGETMRIVTPQGRSLDAPRLECADLGIFLRMTFAAWYKLPFYLTGWLNGKAAYFGHFGVIDRNGNTFSGFPAFKTRYKDHESTWREGQAWPKDSTLRARHSSANPSQDGVVIDGEALPYGATTGTYLDELFLNKRAAYMYILLDAYFGSLNLADGGNTYQVKGEAVSGGDMLIKRWQFAGIGHLMNITHVVDNGDGTKAVSLVQGYMPPRQAEWLNPERAHPNFTNPYSGGEGQTYDNPPRTYVSLGGGLRRWRTPVVISGRWNNIVPMADRGNYIEDTDHEALLERWRGFSTLLSTGNPERAYQIAQDNLEAAREKLRNRPASCSSRSGREASWTELFRTGQAIGKSRETIVEENRKLEDFVFAELIYNQSKTCCWLKPDNTMYSIIMQYAEQEQADAAANNECKQPTPFRLTDGSYDIWKNYATSIGRSADWRDWTRDENPCPAADSTGSDPLTGAGEAAYCE